MRISKNTPPVYTTSFPVSRKEESGAARNARNFSSFIAFSRDSNRDFRQFAFGEVREERASLYVRFSNAERERMQSSRMYVKVGRVLERCSGVPWKRFNEPSSSNDALHYNYYYYYYYYYDDYDDDVSPFFHRRSSEALEGNSILARQIKKTRLSSAFVILLRFRPVRFFGVCVNREVNSRSRPWTLSSCRWGRMLIVELFDEVAAF